MTRRVVCSLRLKLVEDLPGEHVYVHSCRRCGREYGPEFVVYHASTGKQSDHTPIVHPQVCGEYRVRKPCAKLAPPVVAEIGFAWAVANV